ncbi:MAG: hypothetical protein J6S92_05100 [Oscillospiraceae bacterium]|nr:hypothetical protein [Oscillospiraceae bacterium]
MALGEENGGSGIGATMLVSPTGGNFNAGYPMAYPMPVYSFGGQNNGGGGMGFGGDWGSLITLFLLFGLFGGMGNGNGFGGGFGGNYDFPWLLTGQQGINNNVSDGFRTAQLSDTITSVRDGISNLSTQLCGCCSDMQMTTMQGFNGVNQSLCNGFNGVNSSIAAAQSALAQQNYSNQIASLERSYAAQTAQAAGFNGIQSQLAQCCCDNRLGTESLRATVLQENCADRYEAANNTRDIIESQTRSTQAILDKLCSLELDNARRENEQLRTELIFARGQASQTAQTADIRAGQLAATNALVQELRQCPIPAQPVYGSQPIFTCPNNNSGCGCGCNGFNG